jgi:anti-sigma factor RsiW
VDCQQAHQKLNAYWDGELPPRLSDDLERHLKYCPGCQQALARLWQLADLLQAGSPPPMPHGFADRVLALACQRRPRPFGRPRSSWDVVGWWKAASAWQRTAAAAVFLIGLAIGASMGWQAGPRPSSSASRPAAPEDPAEVYHVYNLDSLGSTPEGSLPKAYLQLVSTPSRSGD